MSNPPYTKAKNVYSKQTGVELESLINRVQWHFCSKICSHTKVKAVVSYAERQNNKPNSRFLRQNNFI